MYELNKKNMFSACTSICEGGFAMALAKMSIAGRLGVECNLSLVPNDDLSVEKIMYSETQSRFIITIDASRKEEFENCMSDFEIGEIGQVTERGFVIKNNDEEIISKNVPELDEIYKKRFKDY